MIRIQVSKFDAALPQVADRILVVVFKGTVPGIAAWNGFNKSVVGNEVNLELVKINLPVFGVMIGNFGTAQ